MRLAIIGLTAGAVVILIGFGIVAREIYLRNAAKDHAVEITPSDLAVVLGPEDRIIGVTPVGSTAMVQIRRFIAADRSRDELWIIKASSGAARLVIGEGNMAQQK